MKATVLHLSSAHPPFDTRIFHKECRTLAEAGYDVSLAVPGDEAGLHDGVRLIPVKKASNRRQRVITTQRHLWRIAMASDADILHFHDPDLLPLGLALSLRGRTVVYDSHEDVIKQLADRDWIPQVLRRPAQRVVGGIERMVVRHLAAIISAEPGAAGRFPKNKTVVVQNFPLRREFDGLEGKQYRDRPPAVFYVGDITRTRGALQMVDAIGLLPEELGARFVLAGRINEPGLRAELEESPGWERTEFMGFIGRDELRRHLANARVGIVVMQPTVQYRDATQPVKLFEYLAAGLPVVASDFEAWRPFVLGPGAGVLVDPTSPAAIAEALEFVLRHADAAEAMGARGRTAVLGQWMWASQGAELTRLYDCLLERGTSRCAAPPTQEVTG
ncbi:glycosyltransferase family 4 protein [Actinospongicola halichondriae]|uniref:glycosyltransferase family 4 protein n=1 Tax=Actinospongicola halichondriae TaxID=3236844 RepID=UPI003D4DC0E9